MDFKDKCMFTVRRFSELLLLEIFFSAGVTALNVMGMVLSRFVLVGVDLVFISIFIFVNVRLLHQCYFDMQNSKHLYYFLNISAYLAFFAVNITAYFIFSNEAYGWLFSVTKVAHYAYEGISSFISALIFHGMGLMAVLLAPIGMKGITIEDA